LQGNNHREIALHASIFTLMDLSKTLPVINMTDLLKMFVSKKVIVYLRDDGRVEQRARPSQRVRTWFAACPARSLVGKGSD